MSVIDPYRIFKSFSEVDFHNHLHEVFQYQYESNEIYNKYVQLIDGLAQIDKSNPTTYPFIPISFFKNFEVKSGSYDPQITFSSSGTTGSAQSKHHVADTNLYSESFKAYFENYYGKANSYCIIGLLPSYLEREGSSLIFMVDQLIKESNHPKSQFSLELDDELIDYLTKSDEPKIIFGVTFALLKLANNLNESFKNTIVIETGGMKGHGKELIREELHQKLQIISKEIHSEYGMTELLSQAYSKDGEWFSPPSWMKVFVRQTNDPFDVYTTGKGVLNVIDLANFHSCVCIATDDLGEVNELGQFKVNGRLDNSDLRGCNLLV